MRMMDTKEEPIPGSKAYYLSMWCEGMTDLEDYQVNVLVYLLVVGLVSQLTCSVGDEQTRVARRGKFQPPSLPLIHDGM